MDDKQVRMEVLLAHYEALRCRQPLPDLDSIPSLAGCGSTQYNFALGYLTKHHLMEGTCRRDSVGTEFFMPGAITALGIDLVEEFIEKQSSSQNAIEKDGSVGTVGRLRSIWAKSPAARKAAAVMFAELVRKLDDLSHI